MRVRRARQARGQRRRSPRTPGSSGGRAGVEELELLRACWPLENDLEAQAAPGDRSLPGRVAASAGSVSRSAMNEMSIFSVSIRVAPGQAKRVAGPEVVDRDPEALLAKLVEDAASHRGRAAAGVSVTSSSSQAGSQPASRTTVEMRCA